MLGPLSLKALEDDTALVECLGDGPITCVLSGACLLTRTMNRAREAFFASLDEVTLADVVAPRILLRQRLGVGNENERGLAAIA